RHGFLEVVPGGALRLLRRAAEHLVQDVREATLVSARRPPAGATGRLEAEVEPERPLLVSPTEREPLPAAGPALILAGLGGVEPRLQSSHPELVVEGALLVVRQDVVREGEVLEPVLRLLVARVVIGVILAGELPVRLAYLVGRGALREPEDGV